MLGNPKNEVVLNEVIRSAIFFVAIMLLTGACSSSKVILNIRKSDRLDITALPLELHSKYPLKTLSVFNDAFEDIKDTLSTSSLSFKVYESGLMPEYEYLDIRVKVIFITPSGSHDTFFVSNTGLLSYKGRIYKAPDEFMKFIRAYDRSRPIPEIW